MPNQDPQKARASLISSRKKELLALGYMPGIVDKAMQWAEGCAQGMVGYAQRVKSDDGPHPDPIALANQFLPQYLADSEQWIRSFGHERGETEKRK